MRGEVFHDRVVVAAGAEKIARHRRVRGGKILDALHVLPLLERKHRTAATALHGWQRRTWGAFTWHRVLLGLAGDAARDGLAPPRAA